MRKPVTDPKHRKRKPGNPARTTPRQAMFVQEYLVDLCAKDAAIRAGYAVRSAAEKGYELLQSPHIRALVEQAMKERAARTKISADWVLKRLADQAEADMADLFNADGSLKPAAEWPEVWRRGLVAGVEVVEEFDGAGRDRKQIGWTKKVKLADRLKNIELIGRHVDVGAFREKVEHSGPGGGPIPVAMNADEFRAIAAEMASKV